MVLMVDGVDVAADIAFRVDGGVDVAVADVVFLGVDCIAFLADPADEKPGFQKIELELEQSHLMPLMPLM